MEQALRKFIADHLRVADQYESVGDSTRAAELRAVANLTACLLRGEDAGTLHEPLTDANRATIREKAQAFNVADEAFCAQEKYPDDWEAQIAREEGGRRVIDMILRKPQAAADAPFLQGMSDGIEFMRNR